MAKRIIGDDRARFLSKVDQRGGPEACWIFTGARSSSGYGNFFLKGKYLSAHRTAYLLFVEPIPEGLEVDHQCHDGKWCPGGRNCPHRACVNPAHLTLLSHRDNDLRGAGVSARNTIKTHCPRGHEYNEQNTYWRPGTRYPVRDCRPCRTAAEGRRRQRVRENRTL